MLRDLTYGFHKAINRGANTGLPNVIYLCSFKCVVAYFAVAQSAQGGNSFVESRPFIGRQIVSDFGGLSPDTVNSVPKLITEFKWETLSPRSKGAHKPFELVYTNLPSSLVRVFPVSSVTTNREEVAKPSSNKSTTQERSNRRPDTFGCGFVWHFFLAVLGGVCGYAGYSAFRTWSQRREAGISIPKGTPTPAYFI
jgi:hypothetical protein